MAQRRTHDWASLFEEQKNSGKTAAQFCEEKKIHQNLWYKHKQKMKPGFIEIPNKAEKAEQEGIKIITIDFEIKIKTGCSDERLLSLIKCLGMNHAV